MLQKKLLRHEKEREFKQMAVDLLWSEGGNNNLSGYSLLQQDNF